MRRITAMITILVMVIASCSASTDDAAPVEELTVEESTVTSQTEQEPTATSEPEAQAPAPVDATVVFDGETCSYLGPNVIPAGTEVTFDLDDSARPAALTVLRIEEATTWDQVVASTGPGTARIVPSWVMDYWVQVEAGTLVKTLGQGSYLVTCNTAPDDADAVYPAAFFDVIEG